MAWQAEDSNLLIGDIELGIINASQYLDIAERDIMTHLGQIYALPIIEDQLPAYQADALKSVHAKIATGYLLLAQAAGAENEDLHAYGLYLMKEGKSELSMMGVTYELVGQTTVGASGEDRSPSVSTPDSVSPSDVFASFVHGGGSESLDWSATPW